VGYLTPLDLFKVAAWKTGQGLGSLTLNTEEEFASRTGAAIDRIRPWHTKTITAATDDAMWDDWRETARRAIGAATDQSGLLGLHGVRVPDGNRDLGHPRSVPVASDGPMGRYDRVRDPPQWPAMASHTMAARLGVPGLRPAPGYLRRSGMGLEPLGPRT
jgi:hypothetical protein